MEYELYWKIFNSRKISFDALKWPEKVPDPNFPNWDLPLKWPCKLIPPIFSSLKGSR